MDIADMHINFRQYAQQMGMQNVRAILPEQIDIVINTSIMDTVNQLIRENIGVTNDRQVTDNSKIGQINALRTLYKVEEVTITIGTNFTYDSTRRLSGLIKHVGTNEANVSDTVFGKPMFLVDISINYTNSTDGIVTNWYPVRIIDDVYLSDTLNDFVLKNRWRSPIATVYKNFTTELYIDKFKAGNTPIVEVIGEVIKSYGLTPIIDFTGLEDDLITWTNMKSTGSSSGSSNDGTASDSENHTHCSSPLDLSSDCKVSSKGEIPTDITENALGKIGQENSNYGQWAKGKTPQEVLQGLREGFKWQNYSVTKEGSCATDTFELGKIRANCGDSARLVKCCMDVIGVDCIVIHCPGHFYNAIKVDGTWYTCDLTNRSQCKTKTGTNKFGY